MPNAPIESDKPVEVDGKIKPKSTPVRRLRMRLMIVAIILLVWVAVAVNLAANDVFKGLRLPDWLYTVLILVPLVVAVGLLIVVRRLFRMEA